MLTNKKIIVIGIIALFLLFNLSSIAISYSNNQSNQIYEKIKINLDKNSIKTIFLNLSYSDLIIELHDDVVAVRVPETNFNVVNENQPVIPTTVSIFNLPFGSNIVDITYEHSDVEYYPIYGKLPFGQFGYDTLSKTLNEPSKNNYYIDEIYPSDWVTYHTGGGLDFSELKTFLVLRTYPARYDPVLSEIQFIRNINITVEYEEPDEPIIDEKDVYDLLVISPDSFLNDLQPLIDYKISNGIKTKIVGLTEIYEEMFWQGRDDVEKIKYFIKTSIEEWGIKYVLLVGGLKGQTDQWNLPVRHSHVVPPDEQEYAEQYFISDLYYADIYDSLGGFSSWDSNDDDNFAVWNMTFHEEMDLYPDVYLGRLACRNNYEVKIMVNKIMEYESQPYDDNWFNNLLLVAGDSYPDESGFDEGRLISEKAITLMPDFNPVKIYAEKDVMDINRRTVNNAMNEGAGFAYFCGHGSPASWSTHYPPDGQEWTTGYELTDMMFLRNKNKLPVTVVGGCHNGEFDVTLFNIISGIKEYGLKEYFFEEPFLFYYNKWVPNCWAWWLTSKPGGGAIATIANTGLGTHGENDQDYNGIADYLEVLDGWLELRFLELYGMENSNDLGENHGQAIAEYLHWFLGSNQKMDTKMVQQWELFGDPSLRIGPEI
jgi:hypothetical protein